LNEEVIKNVDFLIVSNNVNLERFQNKLRRNMILEEKTGKY